MNQLIETKLSEIIDLCKKYNVKTMYLFGSACSDKFNNESDVDILITFQELSIDEYTENYFELHYKLESLLGRTIDLLTERSLSNPYFIQSVEKTKQLLYAA